MDTTLKCFWTPCELCLERAHGLEWVEDQGGRGPTRGGQSPWREEKALCEGEGPGRCSSSRPRGRRFSRREFEAWLRTRRAGTRLCLSGAAGWGPGVTTRPEGVHSLGEVPWGKTLVRVGAERVRQERRGHDPWKRGEAGGAGPHSGHGLFPRVSELGASAGSQTGQKGGSRRASRWGVHHVRGFWHSADAQLRAGPVGVCGQPPPA